ncbi:PTS sugar transporter subunit IIA [bacterium]|nr:PTS sugar transporter subunit IIA [bacterium]
MNLVNLINTDLVFIGLKVESKEQALRFLAEKISKVFCCLSQDDITLKILERESISTTTLPNGVAIPHARIENFNDLVISVLIPAAPVMDGDIPIRVFILTLTDLAKSNLYLNVIASIAKICQNEENIQHLISAQSREEFIKRVLAFNIAVKKVIYVRDIMVSPPLYLYPDSTVKDALDLMSKYQIGYIPICDEHQKILGEIIITDILSLGLPQYTQMLSNLKFLSSLEPLEDLLKNESVITLKSIMRKPSIIFQPDSVIIEVIFQFIKNNHRRFFPVVENDKCIGVISYMDIINKFLRV